MSSLSPYYKFCNYFDDFLSNYDRLFFDLIDEYNFSYENFTRPKLPMLLNCYSKDSACQNIDGIYERMPLLDDFVKTWWVELFEANKQTVPDFLTWVPSLDLQNCSENNYQEYLKNSYDYIDEKKQEQERLVKTLKKPKKPLGVGWIVVIILAILVVLICFVRYVLDSRKEQTVRQTQRRRLEQMDQRIRRRKENTLQNRFRRVAFDRGTRQPRLPIQMAPVARPLGGQFEYEPVPHHEQGQPLQISADADATLNQDMLKQLGLMMGVQSAETQRLLWRGNILDSIRRGRQRQQPLPVPPTDSQGRIRGTVSRLTGRRLQHGAAAGGGMR